jgi:hypothetical protein
MTILQALHFSENPDASDTPPTDRLFKIRPLIDAFNKAMDRVVTPSRDLSLDESMVPWRGRLGFRQYTKGKHHRYGIKLHMLTEAKGLALQVLVYQVSGKGHEKVVKKLMENHFDCGHSIYMDNYYNSVATSRFLLSRKTYMTGMLRRDRKGIPPVVLSQKLKKGEVVEAFSEDGLCILRWKDKREVLMISTEFSAQMIDATNRRGLTSRKPQAVVEYNKNMSGIDHLDQMMSYYPIERKSVKWYKKLGLHLLNLLLLNSYFLFSENARKIPMIDFRLQIVETLLALSRTPTPMDRQPSSQPSSSKTKGLSDHFPRLYDKDERQKRRKQKKCKECFKKNACKDTSDYCPACPDDPGLCLDQCFEDYHRNLFDRK